MGWRLQALTPGWRAWAGHYHDDVDTYVYLNADLKIEENV